MDKDLKMENLWVEYIISDRGLIYKGELEPQLNDDGKLRIVCACGRVIRDEGDIDFKVLAGNYFSCPACGRYYVSPIIEVGRYDIETKQFTFVEPGGEIIDRRMEDVHG